MVMFPIKVGSTKALPTFKEQTYEEKISLVDRNNSFDGRSDELFRLGHSPAY